MRLHSAIIMSCKKGFSGAYIFCQEEEKETVIKKFKNIFLKRWFEKIKTLTQDYDKNEYDIKCNEPPIRIYPDGEEDKIYVQIAPLDIMICYGNHTFFEDGNDVLEYSLRELNQSCPDVSYEAYIAYQWEKNHACEIENYEVFSYKKRDDKPKYKFVTDALSEIGKEESFWLMLEESIPKYASMENQDVKEVFDEVYSCFEMFGAGEEMREKLQKIKEKLKIEEEKSSIEEK